MIRIFFCGIIAAVCMILPGISGSMIMIFGVYDSVIKAVSTLNLPVSIPVGLGAVLGSLFQKAAFVFPTPEGFAALGTLVVGVVLSLFFTKEPKDEKERLSA